MILTIKDVYYNRFYKKLLTFNATNHQRFKQVLLDKIDRLLDQLFWTLNQFRAARLYLHPSKVSIEEMNEVEDTFLRLADQNRNGNTMGARDLVKFYFAIQRARYQHLRTIDHMVQALNTYALLRHAFGLDR